MGALDLDHDGFPEVPVAVASAIPIVNFSRSLPAHQLQLSDVAVTLATKPYRCFEINKAELALHRNLSDTQVPCVLRC